MVTPIEKIPKHKSKSDSPTIHLIAHLQTQQRSKYSKFSPYDKTLLIDIHFMVANNLLDSKYLIPNVELAMYPDAKNLRNDNSHPK